RQHELEEVADEVGGADERNDAHVTSHTAANRLRCRANAPPPRHRLTPGRSRALLQRSAVGSGGRRILAAWYHSGVSHTTSAAFTRQSRRRQSSGLPSSTSPRRTSRRGTS